MVGAARLEDDKYQNTSRYGAAQKQIKVKYEGVGLEARTGVTTPLGTKKTGPTSQGRQGGVVVIGMAEEGNNQESRTHSYLQGH